MAKKPTIKSVKEFSQVYKGGLDSEGQLTELVGETMIIEDVEFQEFGNYGEVAVVTIKHNNVRERRHTFSAVLIKQLKAIKDSLPVRAKLTKRKRYYTFE